MKRFESPVLETVTEVEGMERAFVGSGITPGNDPDKPVVPAEGCWKITTEWRNHNSGSHSELAIIGNHQGDHMGESITMNFAVQGFKLATVKDSSGYLVSNVSETGFTITRNNHYNGTDRFEFNIQLTASDSSYSGAVGVTGQPCPHQVICTGYTEG